MREPNPVWGGTDYWTDFIWVSPEPTFNRFDASFLGQTTHAQTAPLQPGQSYTVNYTVTLPPGTGGQYYLYIDLDAHNDLPPNIYIYQARLETTDWWPADTGDNSYWLSEFTEWAFENPNNNRMATPFQITYREPDLTVTNITVPPNVVSGTTVPITYTVTNRGTRATRTDSWTDRIFLSEDPSLDTYDTVLGQSGYGQVLAAGASYTETVNVRIPDGIQGNFDIIVYADSDAMTDYLVAERHRLRVVWRADRLAERAQPVRPGLRGDPQPGAGKRAAVRGRGGQDCVGGDAHHAGAGARLASDGDQQRRRRGTCLPGPDPRRHLHGDECRRRHAADHANVG